jgi:hypothetical protein
VADDGDTLAGGDVEVEPFYGDEVAERPAQSPDRKDRRGRSSISTHRGFRPYRIDSMGGSSAA